MNYTKIIHYTKIVHIGGLSAKEVILYLYLHVITKTVLLFCKLTTRMFFP